MKGRWLSLLAVIGVAAAGAAVGYLAGNAADRRWKTIQVVE